MRNQPSGIAVGGRLGSLPVALHHVVPADGDLADLARRDLVAVAVHDAHLDALDRGPDRAGLAFPVRVVERGHRGGLRQPVPLQHLAAERRVERAQHLDRQRGAAGHAHPERGDVVACPVRDAPAARRTSSARPRRPSPGGRRSPPAPAPGRTAAAASGRRRPRPPRSARRSARTSGTAAARRRSRRRRSAAASWSATTSALRSRLSWVSSAPLGLPVVPEV